MSVPGYQFLAGNLLQLFLFAFKMEGNNILRTSVHPQLQFKFMIVP